MARAFEFVGIDGSNPLGFLAALGTLACLSDAGVGSPRLGWKRTHRWTPILEGSDAWEPDELAQLIADALRGRAVPPDAEVRRAAVQKEMEAAKRASEEKRREIRGRGLRGDARREAEETELRPLLKVYEDKRREWLDALRGAVPRPELALGKRIDCTSEEYRVFAACLAEGAPLADRASLELLAAFGSDAVRQGNSEAIAPTPFCFITGSGHQYFLDTARQLMARVTAEHVTRMLFQAWDYLDEGLSMRWDPIEDRRYALMDRDPTASDNKPRTMWAANLLAYRALALFPSTSIEGKLATAGWDSPGRTFTWPLWGDPLTVDGVRSLVQLRELIADQPDDVILRAKGILAAYRARRIDVGTGPNRKVNFSPARRIV